METEAERYNYIQQQSGLSKKDFAASIGLIKSHGSIISSGRQKLSRKSLQRLSQTYRVSLHWFLTGEGNSGLEADNAKIELLDQEAAAGHGREAVDYPETSAVQVPLSLIAPNKPQNLKAVYISGDSMIGERINDGDIVIFRPGPPQGNGLYIVSIGNAVVCKRVSFDEGRKGITLISANPAYPPRRFHGRRLEELRIVGRVVACLHRV
jgi:SOS-response transcriptional repressor LexA